MDNRKRKIARVHCLATTQPRPKLIYNCLPIHSQHPPPPPQIHRNISIRPNTSRTGYTIPFFIYPRLLQYHLPYRFHRTFPGNLTSQQTHTLCQHDILREDIDQHSEQTRKNRGNLNFIKNSNISLQHFVYLHIGSGNYVWLTKGKYKCPKQDHLRMVNKNLTKRG